MFYYFICKISIYENIILTFFSFFHPVFLILHKLSESWYHSGFLISMCDTRCKPAQCQKVFPDVTISFCISNCNIVFLSSFWILISTSSLRLIRTLLRAAVRSFNFNFKIFFCFFNWISSNLFFQQYNFQFDWNRKSKILSFDFHQYWICLKHSYYSI